MSDARVAAVVRVALIPTLVAADDQRLDKLEEDQAATRKAGPYGDLLCQDRHMPQTTAEVAEGSPPREGMSHHGFRQIVVRVTAVDKSGAELMRRERVYQRLLVDATGRAAPFYLATREAHDHRLRPKEQRVEAVVLEAPEAAAVRLEVLRREPSPEVARAVGRPPPADPVVVTAEVVPDQSVDWQP